MASLILRHKSHPISLKFHHTLLNFTPIYYFSSASSNNDGNDGNTPVKPSSMASLFATIEKNQNQNPQSSSDYFRASNPLSSKGLSSKGLDEIRKNLSDYHRRSSEGSFPANLNRQMPQSSLGPNFNFSKAKAVEDIREHMLKGEKDKGNNNVSDQLSLNNYKKSFQTIPVSGMGNNINNNEGNKKDWVFGGSIGSLPRATFGKEINEKEGNYMEDDEEKRFELYKKYSFKDLGEKLKQLRPDTSTLSNNKKIKQGEDGWFSLSELQQRLGKLKEVEVKIEKESNTEEYAGLRMSLKNIKVTKPKFQKFDMLSQASFRDSVPKEHLIEKYFHPDNMSAAEKLKVELKKVRDEFKMSESDCGSTRVQIAQLTTEIHHLSSVLHKKDKHSRRGLQLKVQQRKKLLKYLRRTDWDSYCFVLSKLGLRDNPDYKN